MILPFLYLFLFLSFFLSIRCFSISITICRTFLSIFYFSFSYSCSFIFLVCFSLFLLFLYLYFVSIWRFPQNLSFINSTLSYFISISISFSSFVLFSFSNFSFSNFLLLLGLAFYMLEKRTAFFIKIHILWFTSNWFSERRSRIILFIF